MPNIIVPLYCRLNNMLFDKFHTIRRNSILSRKTHTITQKSVVLRDSIISPQSPLYKRHPKTKKLGFTHHCDEPHQTSKSLDFKPFFNTFACKYQKSYGIISELPPVPLLYFDDFYPSLPHLPHPIRLSTNGIRQNPLAFMRNPV